VKVVPPLRTDRLYLTLAASGSTAAGDTSAGQPARLPIGLSRVTVLGLTNLQPATAPGSARFRLNCGSGPQVSVDGHAYQTSVSGTLDDLIRIQPVHLQLCAPNSTLALPAGPHRLTAASSADFTVTDVTLNSGSAGAASISALASGAPARQLRVVTWNSDARELRIGSGPASYVEIHENFSPGWTAVLNGRPLRAATLDGWQQAFVVPAGDGGTITLTFAPASLYHDAIIGSGVLLLVVIALAVGIRWPRRRRSRATGAAQQTGAGPPDTGHADTVRHHHAAPPRHLISPARRGGFRQLLPLAPLAAVMVVVGGPLAAAVPVLAVIDIWLPRWRPLIAFGAMLAAGITAAGAANPTILGSGPFSGPAQVFALIALAAALLPTASRNDHQERTL
jgi:arabinofuranan 3-O-arabinosyltransferase